MRGTRPVHRLASFHDARHRAAGTAFGTQLARADHSPPPQRLDLPEALTRQGHPVPLGHVLEHLFVHGPLPADRLAVQVGVVAPGVAVGAGIGIGSTYGYYGSPSYYDDSYGYYDDSVVAAAPPSDDEAVAYCMRRYRSYDPASGTYLGNDGLRHPCPAQ